MKVCAYWRSLYRVGRDTPEPNARGDHVRPRWCRLRSANRESPGFIRGECQVIGGEEIYKLLLSRCQYANLTVVKAMRPADSFFPNLDRLPEWRQIGNSPVRIDEATGLEYQFVRYKKFEDVL